MNSTLFNDLMKNMCEQILVFEEVLDANNHFRNSIVNKDWTSVNQNIDRLNDLSNQVHQLDSSRVNILIDISQNMNSKKNENCYSIILTAPDQNRDRLLEIFYKLKSSVIQAQGVFKGLNSFVEHKKEVSKEIIDVLVKDANGNVYTKPGRRNQASQGFLVNRQL